MVSADIVSFNSERPCSPVLHSIIAFDIICDAAGMAMGHVRSQDPKTAVCKLSSASGQGSYVSCH